MLGIRFEMFEGGLTIFHPNGECFKDPNEFIEDRDQAQQDRPVLCFFNLPKEASTSNAVKAFSQQSLQSVDKGFPVPLHCDVDQTWLRFAAVRQLKAAVPILAFAAA